MVLGVLRQVSQRDRLLDLGGQLVRELMLELRDFLLKLAFNVIGHRVPWRASGIFSAHASRRTRNFIIRGKGEEQGIGRREPRSESGSVPRTHILSIPRFSIPFSCFQGTIAESTSRPPGLRLCDGFAAHGRLRRGSGARRGWSSARPRDGWEGR